MVAKPSQLTGVTYPASSAAPLFGVLGEKSPAMHRGLIAVAWYAYSTMASSALKIVLPKAFPDMMPYADVTQEGT